MSATRQVLFEVCVSGLVAEAACSCGESSAFTDQPALAPAGSKVEPIEHLGPWLLHHGACEDAS